MSSIMFLWRDNVKIRMYATRQMLGNNGCIVTPLLYQTLNVARGIGQGEYLSQFSRTVDSCTRSFVMINANSHLLHLYHLDWQSKCSLFPCTSMKRLKVQQNCKSKMLIPSNNGNFATYSGKFHRIYLYIYVGNGLSTGAGCQKRLSCFWQF